MVSLWDVKLYGLVVLWLWLSTERSWFCFPAVHFTEQLWSSCSHTLCHTGNIIWYWAMGRDALWARGNHWPASKKWHPATRFMAVLFEDRRPKIRAQIHRHCLKIYPEICLNIILRQKLWCRKIILRYVQWWQMSFFRILL